VKLFNHEILYSAGLFNSHQGLIQNKTQLENHPSAKPIHAQTAIDIALEDYSKLLGKFFLGIV
jgi:hypothetical protein